MYLLFLIQVTSKLSVATEMSDSDLKKSAKGYEDENRYLRQQNECLRADAARAQHSNQILTAVAVGGAIACAGVACSSRRQDPQDSEHKTKEIR